MNLGDGLEGFVVLGVSGYAGNGLVIQMFFLNAAKIQCTDAK